LSSPPSSAANLHFLELLRKAFAHHAGKDARIDRSELQKALGLQSEFLAGRVLECFDKDKNGFITLDEFLGGVRTLIFGSDRDKLHFAFRLHDQDGDGFIDFTELFRIIAISMAESDIRERPSQSLDRLAHAVFAKADLDGDGRISFDEFEAIVKARPALLWRMTRSEAIWVLPNEDLLAWLDDRGARLKRRLSPTGDGGWPPVLFVLGWALATAGIFVAALLLGPARLAQNPWTKIGKALTLPIDFNGALILVPMMRRLLTRIRATRLGRFVPIDDAVDFHRLVGHTLFALAVTHSAAFVVAFALGHGRSALAHFFLQSRGLTGAVLLAVFTVMWLFALSFIRRTRHFELFYFTHLLYVVWLGLAIAHAPAFLWWAGVPLGGFVVEQLLRAFQRGAKSAVVSLRALRSGVTRLEIERPKGFSFGAGDYVFLKLPAIAPHEWHPFTISSAPERATLGFHVRSLGNWTGALRALAEHTPDPPGLVARVDGPYGSPTTHVFDTRFAVMIGAGIGVTPFASVLESIVLRHNAHSSADPKSQPPGRPPRIEKLHFYWLNRDQYSFEWFAALLHHLEQIDKDLLLDIHLCMTGGRTGATALGLELAREILHASGESDIVTGLRTHTHLGAPDWDAELSELCAAHHPEPVEVYFCGPPGLGAKIRRVCKRLGMPFREERF
jgi:NADPH oxidase 5